MTMGNSGFLFRNDKKERPNQPDHNGNCLVGGKEYYISAWIKEKDGRKYFSLSFTPKDLETQVDPNDKDVPF